MERFDVVTGRASPSVLANMVLACEQHVEWIGELLDHARRRGVDRIEADAQAQKEWARQVTAGAARLTYSKADSWYMGANVPGKPRLFMPDVDGFNVDNRICVDSRICSQVAAVGYERFRLTGSAAEPTGAGIAENRPA